MLVKIKSLCQSKGISIHELEKACGLGTRTIYRWDITNPAVDKVKAVADYFGCSIDSLVYDTPTERE